MTPSTSLCGTAGLLLDRFSGHLILGVLPRCGKEILQRNVTGYLKMAVKFCMCKVVRNKKRDYSGFIGMII
jgi:ethanolamine utilization microcompartment shell protein EutS